MKKGKTVVMIQFLIGMLIGGIIGIFFMCVLQIARE